MLEQNLSLSNDNLNLNSNGEISLDNRYFDIKKDVTLYRNILAFLPLTGPYSNYGVKTRKALDLSILNSANNKIKIIYFDTGKNINELTISKLLDNIKPSLIIGPFRREVLLDIKPIAKSKFIPILTFSNDISLRENNIWSLGFSPEEQVESVISCALSYGYKNFGLVAPDNLYGRILTNASIDLISDYKSNKYDKILLNNDQINNKPKLFSMLKRFLKFNENPGFYQKRKKIELDVVLNACHGGPGEDGSLQSLLNIFNIKYTGPDQISAQICMDKYAFYSLMKDTPISNS